MSIDWSKYGVSGGDTAADFSKYQPQASSNFSKYLPTQHSVAADHLPVGHNLEQNDVTGTPPPPTWNGVLDNPITHGVETGLKWVAKPFEAVSTTIADAGGALNNLLGGTRQLQTFDQGPITVTHSEKRNLANDVKDIFSNTNENVSSQAWHGAEPNLGKMPGTSVDWANVLDFAAQSVSPGELAKPALSLLGKAAELGKASELQKAETPLLALPEPRSARLAREAELRSTQPPGETPIAGEGNIYQPPTLALPEPKIESPTTARIEKQTNPYRQKFEDLMAVAQQEHFTPGRELEELNDLWSRMAGPKDPSLNDLIDLAYPKRDAKVMADTLQKARQQQSLRDVYGVPNPVKSASDRYRPIVGEAIGPKTKLQRTGGDLNQPIAPVSKQSKYAQERGYNWDQLQNQAVETKSVSPESATLEPMTLKTRETQPTQEPMKPEPVQQAQPLQPANRTETPSRTLNERGHTFTVRTSDVTPDPLKQAYEQPETYKTRSTQKLFDDAQKFIAKNGHQEAYDFVMKAKKMTDRHNAVAQILSKQLANNGDISRAIDVVSKTAQHGTELGRAIQSLSLWNRMDTEGAMLLAQRQINKNAPAGEYRTLTPEQAQPVIAATQKIQQVEQAKSLADDVLSIVSNKAPGEKLTDPEIAKIKEFQKQVTDINGKVKPFLPDKAAQSKKVIEEVNKIPPENRTIDQLRDYWDARAERARRKLAAQRHIGLLPNTENPVLLYAELGVAKIAKGALNLADFSDQMVRELGDKVKPMMNQVYNQSLNMFRKSQGLPTTNELNQVVNKAVKDRSLDAETAAQFKNWANQIAFYTDENLRTEAVQDLQLALRKLDTGTLGQKISSLQAGAQLLSIPTTLRNVIGNEAFNLLEKVNKLSAIPIDWALSKLTGERTIIFNPQNQEKYWENWFNGAQAGWNGVSPNGKLSSYDIRPEVFGENNPLKYVTKLTGAELQSFDHAAYMRPYGDVLATYAEQLGKTQGLKGRALKEAIPSLIKQLDQSIYDMAEEAGQYATFQDDTVLSKAAEAVKKGLNYPTKLIGDAAVNAGILPESFNPSGFGLGDIVLKYAKTPANIVMRAIDYSPIGIGRGILQMVPLLTKREFNQRQAVLALSRGITGTLGMTGLGYYLASQGILTGAPSSDKDVKALQDAAGQKGYQVNLSALRRWAMGGLDKNAAKYQNGDTLINYDWLQPMAISLAMGVNMNQAQNEKKAGVTKTPVQIAGSMILGGLETVMQQPLVQGVQQVADATSNLMKNGSWSGFANIMKGIPASFVPALSSQARNFTDNTARSTYDPSVLKSMVNMVINKIPGLAERLPPQIDSLSGQPKQVVDGGQAGTLSQGLNVFANPAKVSQYHVSPEAAMVVQLINDTGDNRVAPRVPNRYLMVDKKKVDLTPEQYVQLQQNTSQYTAQQLQHISPMLTNPNVPDANKVNAVVKVLNDAGSRARKQLEHNYPELKPKKAAR